MPSTWTNTQIVTNLLRSGVSWSGATVTFGFPTTAPTWSFQTGEGSGFTALTESQKAMAQLAISLWDDLVATDFVETTSAPQITLQNTTTNIGYAHAYYPGNWAGAGSVWFNPAYGSNSGTNNLVTPVIGSWGALAYIHELGHALGLDHPGDYNGGSPTYANDALYAQDTIMYSVMSYFDASNTGADWVASNGKTYYAQTPMIHDILAIQALYGADMTTRSTDTIYGFNSDTGSSIYDFSLNLHPVLAIWDGGGIDWLDLSGFATASNINLNQGAFSDCDGMTKNISIAYNCTIENAAGGAGNDSITGNEADNTLVGNGGNDVLTGGDGADILIGGDGNDTFYADAFDYLLQFSGGLGYDILYYSGTLEYTYDFAFYGFEEMVFTDTNPPDPPDAIMGTESSETLNGTDSDDTIIALGGNDTLDGKLGADLLEGGNGDDTYIVDNADDVVNESTGSGVDTVKSSVTFSLANTASAQGTVENLTLTGTGNINATGNAADNTIAGNRGTNVLDGGDGTDTVTYAASTTAVTVNLSLTSAQNTGTGAGTDTLFNFENLVGSNYADKLTGSTAANVLTGLNGNDTISGGAGTDTITGGAGKDIMTGGADADTFVFTASSESARGKSRDVITDFLHGTDKIDLGAIDAVTGGSDSAFAFIGSSAFTGQAGSLRVYVSKGQTIVAGDINGDKIADFEIALSGNQTLTASDFIL